ncbi:MAG: riboflavin synthase [Opitutales bacterium]|nr:riboflavin synthase [Opitutales bacterium]
MFTGIVEATGKVLSLENKDKAWLMKVEAPGFIARDLNIGDSLANNGCCLTVVAKEGDVVSFELLEETLRLTSFEGLTKGSLVNLERPLQSGARLGGHFVSGHVDVRAKILEFEKRGKNFYLRVEVPGEFSKYVVYKGSIAIDGISLTIAEVHADSLAVWLIPHTLEVTNLSQATPQKFVNLEFDLLAKYVEKIASGNRENSPYQPQ